MYSYRRWLAVLLVVGAALAATPVAMGTAALSQQSVDADTVILDATIGADGDASWTVTYRLRLADANETAAFEELRAAIEQLRTNASSLAGPEVAAIARTIGGPPDGVRGGDEAEDAEDEQRESDDDESETTPEAGAGDGNETSTNETEAEETAEPGAGQGDDGDAGNGGGGIYTLGGVEGDR